MTPGALRLEAESLAQLAAQVLRERFDQVRTIEFKGGRRSDLVTDADRAAEQVVISRLQERFPEHGLLAEESGAVSEGELRWVFDPLDGTTNYAHGVPHFCVSLAVEGPWGDGRRVLAAAIVDPLRDELFSAARGEGATLNGRPIRTSTEASLERALLCTGFPYDVQTRPEVPLGLFERLVRKARGMRRMGSAALDLAWVAAGRFDGFFEFGLKPWDVAAGALLIEEAGGTLARIDGAPWTLPFGDVVAAGPRLFEALSAESARFVQALGWVPTPFSPPPS